MTPEKKRLLFFRWRYDSRACAPFVLANKRLTEKGLAPFFEVRTVDYDCDLAREADDFEPELIMFESGSPTLPFSRPEVRNVRARPEIPRIGLLESDPHAGCRSVFAADMDRLGIDTFFTRATSMGDYFPEIAPQTFLWPWHLDETIYRDRGEEKRIVLTLTGACSPPYPWRQRLFELLAERFPTLRIVHGGYLRSQARTQPWGEDYSRLLNASLFSASCGTAWKLLVKKHLEISGSGCCLVAEKTPIIEAAGFRDQQNCLLGDERDLPDKMEALAEEPERLAAITRAGVELVLRNHLNVHRPQIRQWLDLTQAGVGEITQCGPFGDLVPRAQAPGSGAHLDTLAEDRVYLRRGLELLARNHDRAAAIMFNKMLELAWHMPEANLGMAQCDLFAGLPESACKRLRITLKWCMKQYKCPLPNPDEWAWHIVAVLCRGHDKRARAMAAQFAPGRPYVLRHPQYEHARALTAVVCGQSPPEPAAGRTLPSIHTPAFASREAFFQAAAMMLSACGQPSFAQRVLNSLDPRSGTPCPRPRPPGNTEMLSRLFAALHHATRFHGRTPDRAYHRVARLRARLPRHRPGRVRLPFGTIRYADAASLESQYFEIFVQGGYDLPDLAPDGQILDCGANIGLASIRFGLTHPQARIVSYEPDPELFVMLQENLAAAGVATEAVQAALWTEAGELPFCHDKADAGRLEAGTDHCVMVRTLRLADEIMRRGPVELLKLDIEGAELAVLPDLAASGALNRVRALCCELHALPSEHHRIAQVLSLLHAAGLQATLAWARAAPALYDESCPSPFACLPDGKYLAHLYAWRASPASEDA